MFLSLLEKRRSIRKFQDKPIEKEKIDRLVEAALRSPSSRGFYPWQFVVITDTDTVETLSKSKDHGSAFLKGAPACIVVCADPEKSDVWVEDASIAAIVLHLAATDLGLGSCWIQIRKRTHDGAKTAEAFIQEVLGIPERIKVEAIIALGYAAEEKASHKKESLLYHQVYLNRYGSKLE